MYQTNAPADKLMKKPIKGGHQIDPRVRQLLDQGGLLFSKRMQLVSLWQEIGDNFYPERADFTVTRNIGRDFAANLSTSYPIIARRDLGNAFGAMLRPKGKPWFYTAIADEDLAANTPAQRWLEWATDVQRRAMYDLDAQFVRATKEGDNDFAAFGQCVLSVEWNIERECLLYRCWHLRDVVWREDIMGRISEVHRDWKPMAVDLHKLFKGKVSEKVVKCLEKEPYKEIKCRHIIIPSDQWKCPEGMEKWGTPYVSIHIDVDNSFVMEEVGVHDPYYIIPRWQTVSGSQYAFSPATVAALADARLIQAMTLTLLEAGEKATNPPMKAVEGAVRSDINIFAGGVTWVDQDYDERLGGALEPVKIDKSGLPFGREMVMDVRGAIMEAFYLNKISLPPAGQADMTMYEASERVNEYIRAALPLFEPMEMDYNGQVCERTFGILLRNGQFGSPFDMPEELQGKEIQFRFVSPFTEASERVKAGQFIETKNILTEAIALDPSVAGMVNAREALRDVLKGVAPAKWMRTDEEIAELDAAAAQQQQTQQLLQTINDGALVAKNVGDASTALNQAEAPSPTDQMIA